MLVVGCIYLSLLIIASLWVLGIILRVIAILIIDRITLSRYEWIMKYDEDGHRSSEWYLKTLGPKP